MKRTVLRLGGVVVLGLVLCLLNFNIADAGTTVLKFQCAYGKSGSQGDINQYFAKKVGEYTKGEVEVKLFWPGQLVSTGEAFAAIKRGAIEGYCGALQYFSGDMPEASGQFYYSWDNPMEAVEIYYDYGYIDVLREAAAKHDVYYIAPISCNNRSLLLKFPVHKMEDMQGKKIRGGGGGCEAQAVLAWGASPTSIAAAEQYTALQRGTIEGTLYPWYTLIDMKFHEVVKYLILPPVSSPGIVDIVMSKKGWDKLSPANKEAIDRAGKETMWYSMTKGLIKDAAILEAVKEKGIEIITLSPGEAARFRQAALTAYDEYAKKTELCAKQIEILKKYAKDKGR
ncbi:MAG: TRAP transporter substrate-binding protein DctP [Deltaproteobacteria bacterium]|nr:TRAP transporter substrate-binding protein DctP [Deltaproteobacteria bacterium]